MITAEKWQQLLQRMAKLKISEKDLQEQFILGSGRGGQKIQKTSSCVRLHHKISGIIIKCSDARSREQNRFNLDSAVKHVFRVYVLDLDGVSKNRVVTLLVKSVFFE